jgi:site-specific DNA-methyltransferase (adenine-specific)
MIQLIQGDCLEEMDKLIEFGVKVDAIIGDLPYGTTACSWDEIIPFAPMWERVKKINNGVFVTTASQPFTSKIVMSNIENFKYSLVWEKLKATGHLDARRKPLKAHEDILVFYQGIYNPQLSKGAKYKNHHKPGDTGQVYGEVNNYSFDNEGTRFPRSVIYFTHETEPEHPTQKPVGIIRISHKNLHQRRRHGIRFHVRIRNHRRGLCEHKQKLHTN